jgi:hypothetical protein
MEIRQALHLKRGDRVQVTLPVPVLAENENIQFQIRERGRTLQAMGYTGLMSGHSPEQSPVLLIGDPATPFGTAATNLLRSMKGPSAYYGPGPYARGVFPKLDFMLGPTRVPTNWLGFTSLRAVLAGAAEWDQLSEGQKSALLAYVACGGKLMLVDGNLSQLFPNAPPATSFTRYLFGTVQFPKLEEVTQKGLDEVLAAASSNDSVWTLPANHEPEWVGLRTRVFVYQFRVLRVSRFERTWRSWLRSLLLLDLPISSCYGVSASRCSWF